MIWTTVSFFFSRNLCTKNRIITSKFKPITIPKIGLPEFIWSKNEQKFDKIAIQSFETGRSYTYYELYKKSLGLSKFFKKKLKLNKQDTVAIVLNNIPEYPIIVLAAINAGLKITTCNPNYTVEETKRQFQSAQPRVVVTLDSLTEKIKLIAPTLPLIKIFKNGLEEIITNDIDSLNYEANLNDTIMLLYSSGTTGLPKGVEFTHSNTVSTLSQSESPEIEYIKPSIGAYQDIIPLFLPLFHVYALNGVLLHGLAQGAKLVTMTEFSSNSFITMLKAHKPNLFFCTPPQLLMISNNDNIKTDDFSCFRTIYCGAAPLKASDLDLVTLKTGDKIPLFQIYGLTELSRALSQSNVLEQGMKIGGTGFVIPNTFARIIDIESKKDLGPNQSGELVLKGPQVMKGYFNNPEATKEAFLEKDWFRTGDIAYYDEDEHFFITDRLKEIIKVKGFQVAPAELEGILREHPQVEDAAVIGVPHNITGEAPKAFIVCKKGQRIEPNDLQKFMTEKVTNYKRLTGGIVFIDEIPKTSSGKILRKNLKNL